MSQSFVRVPPQSTGKRVLTTDRYSLRFDNLTGNFAIGAVVVGATSDASGTITAIDTDGFISTEGVLWLTNVTGIFLNNENLEVNSAAVAIANIDAVHPFVDYSIQNIVISDPENPTHKQRIDRFGATVNTFTDGSPTFGSFGTLTVGEPQVIKDYRFAYDGRDTEFWDNISGTGAVTYEAAAGGMLLSVGTLSGAAAQRTTHFYHPYSPGVGHMVELTIRCGDAGKANNIRRWGYFDDDNGVFFELDGSQMYAVIRSNVSGSVVDTRVPQSEWNVDPFDGSDNIGFDLEVFNPNIYWIDLQWLGAGRVRFGVVEPSGSRLVGHLVEHANSAVTFPYMRTASLPIRVENFNTGVAAGSSELRLVCAVVKHSSKSSVQGDRRNFSSGLKTITTAGGEVPILAIRPKTAYSGQTNRGLTKIIAVNMANVTATGAGPVVFRFYGAPSAAALTGHSFGSGGAASITEIDTTATALVGGQHMGDFIVGADQSRHVVTPDARELHTLELFLNADAVTQPLLLVTAECLSGTSASVYFSANCEEIKY